MSRSLSTSPSLRIITLCALYIAQGLPYGFVTIALKNHLSARGVSVAEIGALLSMVVLPWAFKFLWGPLIDRFSFPAMGRRRPWLLLAQLAAVTTLIGCAVFTNLEDDIRALSWALFSLNFFLSLQDVSTDSLAVDLLNEKERGKANGFMYGSSYVGTFLGGAVIGHFLTRDGGSITSALLYMAFAIFLISLLPLFLRERTGEKLFPWSREGSCQIPEENAGATSLAELLGMLRRAFSKPVALLALVYAFFAYFSDSLLSVAGSNFFVTETDWTDESYSKLESIGLWFSLGGAVLGGLIADRLGIKRVLITSGTILALCWVSFGLLNEYWKNSTYVSAMFLIQSSSIGVMAVSSFSLFMGISDRKVAATQFTGYMAMLNLSTSSGNRMAGNFTSWIPSRMDDLYLLCGLFHLSLMLFVFIFLHPSRESPDSQNPPN